MSHQSKRAMRADQKRFSRTELKKMKGASYMKSAVRGAKNWFQDRITREFGKNAWNRLCFSAKIRKMTPQAYAEKVLLR